jgi:sialic acid synthase SpsE/sugar phosphate isomerase/epimerase
MIIQRNVDLFQAHLNAPLKTVLELIDQNRSGILFVTEDDGRLWGVVTDGDIRRWLLRSEKPDLESPAYSIANRDYTAVAETTEPYNLRKLFSVKVRVIPILDRRGKMVGIAKGKVEDVDIGGRKIGPNNDVFVIAEIGNNHNGSLELGKQLIDKVAECEVPAAKFQMRNMELLYGSEWQKNRMSEDLGSQYVVDLLARVNLAKHELYELFDYCHQKNIIPLCTPWDEASVDDLEAYGIEAYKIASADLTNHQLLESVASKDCPAILSTGMSRELEIIEGISIFQKCGTPLVLLHCNSTYPPDAKDINLAYINRLDELGSCPVGYSGHEIGWTIAVAAVAVGATVIEKHFTLDRTMEGNDHKISLLPEELLQMAKAIQEVKVAMGSQSQRTLNQGEVLNRETLAKSLFATRAISRGETIEPCDVVIQAPGKGIQPNRYKELVGRVATRQITQNTEFFESDITGAVVGCASEYSFKRPWGIPVRYHDYRQLMGASNQSLLEFHMSYGDLEHEPRTFLKELRNIDLVVHAPELFSGDHLIDLAADSSEYRERSIREIQRVLDCTRQMSKFFPDTSPPRVILNAGGWTEGQRMTEDERIVRYERIRHGIKRLAMPDVELLIQTMPPFPWHFGGRSYHNLFVLPEEIDEFCAKGSARICLDISHSFLACKFHGIKLNDFIKLVGSHIAHIHWSDARGTDGEGLQIGEGEVEFKSVFNSLDRYAPGVSFIPEIWQGHKNGGEGFWIALSRLEDIYLSC